jgi:hypothetical protein
MTRALGFMSILGVALGALAGMAWYAIIPLGAVSLTFISALEQRRYGLRSSSPALLGILPQTSVASFGNATVAALAAYALGALVRFATFG